MKRIIYFGPPGTGKTTTLLGVLADELKAGVPVERIGFLTFTRRAKREAVDRVGAVLGIVPKDLPYFRTIHSMAFRALQLKKGDVLDKNKLDAFGRGMGLTFGLTAISEQASEGITGKDTGDVLIALDNLARLRQEPLKKTWSDSNCSLSWTVVDHFSRSYSAFKKEVAAMDYTDMLEEFVRAEIQLPLDVCFVDEAQDLSRLQWRAVLRCVVSAERQYIAGDDDQAIYRWAGADVDSFMELDGERRVLNYSYRLPRNVHSYASRILHNIKRRVAKQFSPRDADGLIRTHIDADSIQVDIGDNWLWLVRNRFMMNALRASLEQRGKVYTTHGASSINESDKDAIYAWEALRKGKGIDGVTARNLYDYLRTRVQIAHGQKKLPGLADHELVSENTLREQFGLLARGTWYEVLQEIPERRRYYYRQLLRAHGTLKLRPSVQLETIHGAKGAEADKVALFLGQSRRTYEESQINPDDEHRVFYVGATRAKSELHLVQPSETWGFKL